MRFLAQTALDQAMHIQLSRHDAATVLTPIGRIDQNSAESFQQGLQPHLTACTKEGSPLVLDFSGVDYISSVGLRVLMLAARQAKAQGGRIGIAALQPIVREVFEISRFHLVLPVFEDVASAARGQS
jgi:anti-sigma B factor antagonist